MRKGTRQQMCGGAEYDLLFAKQIYCYLKRPGVSHGIKRQMSRRRRREEKALIGSH